MTTSSSSIRTEATNDPNFRVWYISGATTSPMWCAKSQSYPISGDYIGCCGDNVCARPTECVSGTLFYSGTGTASTKTCSENRICVTMTVYEAPSPALGTARRDIFCAGPGWAKSGYLALPQAALASSTGASNSGTAQQTTTGATSSPSGNSDSGSGSGSGSKAWIAGVVIGPLVGIALGVAVFFMLRRRWTRKHEQQQQQQQQQAQAGAGASGAPPVAELDWNKTQSQGWYPNQQQQYQGPPPELESNQWEGPPLEMDAGQPPARS